MDSPVQKTGKYRYHDMVVITNEAHAFFNWVGYVERDESRDGNVAVMFAPCESCQDDNWCMVKHDMLSLLADQRPPRWVPGRRPLGPWADWLAAKLDSFADRYVWSDRPQRMPRLLQRAWAFVAGLASALAAMLSDDRLEMLHTGPLGGIEDDEYYACKASRWYSAKSSFQSVWYQ